MSSTDVNVDIDNDKMSEITEFYRVNKPIPKKYRNPTKAVDEILQNVSKDIINLLVEEKSKKNMHQLSHRYYSIQASIERNLVRVMRLGKPSDFFDRDLLERNCTLFVKQKEFIEPSNDDIFEARPLTNQPDDNTQGDVLLSNEQIYEPKFFEL